MANDNLSFEERIMKHAINRVVLQGRAAKIGPAGESPNRRWPGSTELQIDDYSTTTLTVCGIGIDAAMHRGRRGGGTSPR